MRRFLLLISLFAGMGSVHAQSGTLRMRLVDRTGREPVAGAVVELLAQADTTRNPLYTASGGDGEVRLQQVPAGEWLLRVTSLGYKPLARPVRTSGGDDWGKRAKITASYFFNRADNRNESLTDRQTFTSTEKLVLYDAQGDSRIENTNHRFNSRFDYRFNDQHSLMMRTAFSIQDYLQQGETFSRTDNRFSEEDIRFVNRRRSFSFNDRFGYTVSNNLIYRYRLPGSCCAT